jgi:oxygen-independent coproporphyrinogen-3 oxidase
MSGLYVHIPFCIQKCDYCDFYSEDDKNYLIQDYLQAVIKELQKYKYQYNPVFDTLYIGGGTPTSISEKFLDFLFSSIFSIYPKSCFKEITIEINPETLTEKKTKVISLNVTRASVGAQSFNDDLLKILNRVHNSETIKKAIGLLRQYDINNINIDIMFGIPQQKPDDALNDLKQTIDLKPSHISYYMLTLYKNTKMYGYKLPDDKLIEDMYLKGVDFLNKNGFIQYEISNFCQKGKECIHNLNYWNIGQYIGVGASASSYYNNERYTNIKSIAGYINKINKDEKVIDFVEKYTEDKKLKDYIILKLRTTKGILYDDFKEKFKFDFKEKYSNIIDKLVKAGLSKEEKNSFSLTERGFIVSNKILQEFI